MMRATGFAASRSLSFRMRGVVKVDVFAGVGEGGGYGGVRSPMMTIGNRTVAIAGYSTTTSPVRLAWNKPLKRPCSFMVCHPQSSRIVMNRNHICSVPLRCYSTTGSVSHHVTSTATKIQTTFDLPDPAALDPSSSALPLLVGTKIVATIGPTSEQAEPLKRVVAAGMNVMRLNFSHATREEVELRTSNLEAAMNNLSPTATTELQDVRAILLDTKGPEIRSGTLQNDFSGHETVTFNSGETVTLHTSDVIKEKGSTAADLYIDYRSLATAVQVGGKVLLDDGAISLTVEECHPESGTVLCRIDNTGDLRSRAGVNLPLADTTDLPAMSEKDKQDILYGMQKDIDFVAASFVQTPEHVQQIRDYMEECATRILRWPATRPRPLIISKIETASSLVHFDAILEASDGIMVARGDLGVEIPLAQVTNAQKEMVAACNAAGKPVIVATQMLESMTKSPRPTRAEVSDVTNAVYDGADAVMLSGETAKGRDPAGVVKFMRHILQSAERYMASGHAFTKPMHNSFLSRPQSRDSALAQAAVSVANERGLDNCAAIVVLTHHGLLPSLVAAFRPLQPILAVCPNAKMARRLQLYRNVHPIIAGFLDSETYNHPAERAKAALKEAVTMGYLQTGDEVVMVSMDDDDSGSSALGRTANMKIAVVP